MPTPPGIKCLLSADLVLADLRQHASMRAVSECGHTFPDFVPDLGTHERGCISV